MRTQSARTPQGSIETRATNDKSLRAATTPANSRSTSWITSGYVHIESNGSSALKFSLEIWYASTIGGVFIHLRAPSDLSEHNCIF